MFFKSRSAGRPFHFGSFPLETLPRDESVLETESSRPPVAEPVRESAEGPLVDSIGKFTRLYAEFAEAEAAKEKAPVSDDLERRSVDIKGVGYFMDASQVGICQIPDNAWLAGSERPGHDHAIVVLIEHSRVAEEGNLAREWMLPAVAANAEMRAAEIAALIAGHIRVMGYGAHMHGIGAERLDSERLTVLAGLAVRQGEKIVNPFVGEAFSVCVVSTDYPLAVDKPLAANAAGASRGFGYWLGRNGARSGRERNRRAKRRTDLGPFAMETVKRVDRPTTLILDEEVPRVPKRASFFERALQGDLGVKAQMARRVFSFKHPLSRSQLEVIRSMVPYQDGPVAEVDTGRFEDAEANTRALKSLAYFLGTDVAGICEVPRYAWYSHKANSEEIEPYHKYAVVMLIDQGFDTMEGASGDDWISGAQSMRAYLRGAEIASVMADLVRANGFPARSQTNADSDVLHIPLVLWAGLGELSRIGELILNPFLGPRLKTVVMTTDMPLVPDKPIDFGLQYFCNHCFKCARECPCDAIPWGDKVMFNGYEMWKPDVERCTRYRLTNVKGSACGRCMKTCPLNKVVDADGPLVTRAASWLGINAMFLKPLMVPVAAWLDDALGNGKRNPLKKWWFDHEVVNGVATAPRATNQRDIDPSKKLDPANQKMAYYHANMMPPPDSPEPFMVDRKQALAAKDAIETPDEARARREQRRPYARALRRDPAARHRGCRQGDRREPLRRQELGGPSPRHAPRRLRRAEGRATRPAGRRTARRRSWCFSRRARAARRSGGRSRRRCGTGFRTVAVNPSAYGDTEPFAGREPMTIRDEAAATAAVIRAELANAAGGRVHFVGHSYGGTIGLVLALEWPDLVDRMTLLEPAPYPLLREAGETAFAAEIEGRNGDFIATVRGGGLDREAMESYLDYFNARPGYWRSLDRETQARMLTLSERLAVGLEAVGRLELSRADLAAIAVPVTVVRGGATDPLHARLSELVAGAIPGAALADLPGAGHMMTLTHGPRDRGNPADQRRRGTMNGSAQAKLSNAIEPIARKASPQAFAPPSGAARSRTSPTSAGANRDPLNPNIECTASVAPRWPDGDVATAPAVSAAESAWIAAE